MKKGQPLQTETILEQATSSDSRVESRGDSTWDGKITDKTIKFCPSCRRCYDTKYYKDVVDSGSITYYDDFPTYGKEKLPCGNCA